MRVKINWRYAISESRASRINYDWGRTKVRKNRMNTISCRLWLSRNWLWLRKNLLSTKWGTKLKTKIAKNSIRSCYKLKKRAQNFKTSYQDLINQSKMKSKHSDRNMNSKSKICSVKSIRESLEIRKFRRTNSNNGIERDSNFTTN